MTLESNEKLKNIHDAMDTKLAPYLEEDKKRERAARNFVPQPRIVTYMAGEFLTYDDVEIPRAHIVEMTAHCGDVPAAYRSSWGSGWSVRDDNSHITIHLASGRTVRIETDRHRIDILFAALVNAWKHGKSVIDHSFVEA